MIVDCGKHAGVAKHQQLFDYMPQPWQKHFDHYEWTGAVGLASNHIRVSDKFVHDELPAYKPETDPTRMDLVIPYQGLTVNGWADRVGAGVYVEALNGYGLENWTSRSSKLAIVVSPFDPEWSAGEIRKRAKSPEVGGVCIPLTTQMLGTRFWDPIYKTCVEAGLPVVVHFSGVEGSYSGTPPLSGTVHRSAFSRLVLMPHLAESNVASMMFEGVFYRFPELQVLFIGFGCKWVPALMRRADQEWRNFRADMPWVKNKPSVTLLSNMWFGSYPVGELRDRAHWEGEFSAAFRGRIVFNSEAPFGQDSTADIETILGEDWLDSMMRNGSVLLKTASSRVEA